jgi:HrpA-like RNA helicase
MGRVDSREFHVSAGAVIKYNVACSHTLSEAAALHHAEEICAAAAPPPLHLPQAMGIDNVMRFDWLAPPPAEAVVRGLELLHALGALDGDAK